MYRQGILTCSGSRCVVREWERPSVEEFQAVPAAVTPSLVMRGAPKLSSSTTLHPRGPRVTLSMLLKSWTSRSIFSRALVPNRISFAAMAGS